jgi:stage II sporulation protein D
MRRMLMIVAFFMLESFCAAQQPDVRVRLLSLYRLSGVKVQTVPGAKVEWGMNSAHGEFRSKSEVHAHGNSVEAGGQIASKLTLSGDFRIFAEHASVERIHGTAEISAKDSVLQIVVLMPVDQYVATVLQGETAGNMPSEALKAMAVTIRSYTTRFRERHKEEGFDFCDSTHCQYLRLDVQPAVLDAVNMTAEELLWDRGTPLAAYYHKDCGGRTEDAAVVWPDQGSPSLISHADPYCVRASDPWRSEVSRADLDRAIAAAGLAVPPGWNRIVVAERTPSGRAQTLRFSVGETQSSAMVSASTLRFAVGRTLGWNILRSDWYDVSAQGDHFVFRGRGVGHGVGLCQTGAGEMAREGKNYRDILAFYYSGALIGRSAQGIPWTQIQTEAFELRVVSAGDRTTARTAAHSALEWAIATSGLSLHSLPLIEVYPTVAMFRDATGEPGWVAASTRHQRMRVQSPSVLHEKFESVLRHEFLHMLVEDNAAPGTPLWFREGLVVYLGGDPPAGSEATMSGKQIDEAIALRRSEAEMREAYAQAAALARDLDRRYGRKQLIGWLRDGFPQNVRGSAVFSGADKVSH